MKTLRAMVVDDEAMARKALKLLIEDFAQLEWVGEASSGLNLVNAVESLSPDIVFLDIKMPHVSGLEAAQEISGLTHIVFTTAYDQYALTAFELGAVDYLLKPFGKKRFQECLNRILDRYSLAHLKELQAFYRNFEAGFPFIFVRTKNRFLRLPYTEIVRIQSAGNYIEIHTDEDVFLFHLTMLDAEKKFAPMGFIRAHRSHLVNEHCIESLEKTDHRTYLVKLKTGDVIESSRSGALLIKHLLS